MKNHNENMLIFEVDKDDGTSEPDYSKPVGNATYEFNLTFNVKAFLRACDDASDIAIIRARETEETEPAEAVFASLGF